MSDKKYQVYVIEDDALLSEMIRDFVHKRFPKMEVQVYDTGEKALEDLSGKPDVIILDYNLNSVTADAMNGLLVLKRLREQRPGTPVIFMSGQENPEVSANTIRYGAFDYIVKNEQSYDKLEIILKNIEHQLDINRDLSMQKVFNILLIVLFFVMLAALIILKIYS